MRQICEARPELGFLLVDLRGHGASPSMDPPHDLESAAADLVALEQDLDIAGVIGHSLGGKIALAYGQRRPDLEQIWVLDSQPGARDGERSPTMDVLRLLESLPESYDDRAAFVRAIEQAGQPRALANWLAMSVKRGDDGRFHLVIDRVVARALIEAHFRSDLWEALSRDRGMTHVVVGDRSFVWQPGDRERLEAAAGEHLAVHRLDAGHWLQVDAPDALRELLIAEL
jgi:pimeloyl-ACP methyl ester carboxylesterase